MSGPAAVAIDGLVKDFPIGRRGFRRRAVDHLSLRIEPGQIFGLLGGNGSGKSTTIRVMLDLLPTTAGECYLFGRDHREADVRRRVGYVADEPAFPRQLTGGELLRFHGALGGVRRAQLEWRVADMLERVGLTPMADLRLEKYSRGMLQRIGLAQALVHEPRLLILDEPLVGLDGAGVEILRALLVDFKVGGGTAIIVSHWLEPIADLCDRFAVLEHGRLLGEGPSPNAAGARQMRD